MANEKGYMGNVTKKTTTTKKFKYTDEENPGVLIFILFIVLAIVWMVWDTLKPSNFYERAITICIMLAAYWAVGTYRKCVRTEETTVEERE